MRKLLLGALVVLLFPASAGATTYTFSPTADVRVKSNAPTTNYGSLQYMVTNGTSTDIQEALLRFNVTGLDGPVQTATLRGHTYDSVDGPAANGPAVYATSGTWAESTVTWNTRPPSTGAAFDDLGAVGRNVDFDMNVTAGVTGEGSVNFLMRQPTGDGLYFYSKEFATVAQRPKLIVTTSPAPTPTPTPSPTPTATPTPTPTPTPTAQPTYPLRGMFFGHDAASTIASKGFNLIDSDPGNVDDLAAGLKGMTWIGEYDKQTCQWLAPNNDAGVRADVQAHIGDPKVGVWFIADEPWQGDDQHCTGTPAQMKARTDLIHSIDPNAKTLLVLDGNSDFYTLDGMEKFKGTADYIGVNAYMCWQGKQCRFDWIDTIAAKARAIGMTNLWGVAQSHGDTSSSQTMCVTNTDGSTDCGMTRVPTAAEVHTQMQHWDDSGMKDYIVFSWRWPDSDPSLWLENNPLLQDQWKIENDLRTPEATPTPTPSPTPTPTATPTPTPTPPPSGDPVVAAAGDIADDGTGDTGTANLILGMNPDRVVTMGDNAYDDGTLAEYNAFYDPTWGQFKAKTRPTPGNHEYHTTGASGYFDYFNGVGVNTGPAGTRGQGYYSFDVGAWHLIALNNYVSHSASSTQVTWLKNDLAANAGKCTIAYWHAPLFTSTSEHGPDSSVKPYWDALYAAGADVVLNGHNHHYERFARQNPTGQVDTIKGIREFVVGTGGTVLYQAFSSVAANSDVRSGASRGVLKLTLHAGSYDWRFEKSDGSFAGDSGSTAC